MSDEKKDSGLRGRIDRFFDKQAKEQQNLLQGKVGGTSIKESWDDVKSKVGSTKSSKAITKVHKVKSLRRACLNQKLKR